MPVTPTMGSHSALRVILGADAEREFGERERRDGGEGGLLGDGVREGGREKAIERGEEIGEVLPLSGGGVGMQQEQEQGSDDSTPLASTSDSTPTSAA